MNGVRGSGGFRVDVGVEAFEDLVGELVRSSVRFDLLDARPGHAVIIARPTHRSWGERIEVTYAELDANTTDVLLSVEPTVKTTLVDLGQGEKDIRAVADRLAELASGPPLPARVERAPKPRGWSVLAVVGFALVVVGVLVTAGWWLTHYAYLEIVLSMPLPMGFVLSLLSLRAPRVGLRGRRLAIAGVIAAGLTYLALIAWIVGIASSI
jgi:hypothetical protein